MLGEGPGAGDEVGKGVAVVATLGVTVGAGPVGRTTGTGLSGVVVGDGEGVGVPGGAGVAEAGGTVGGGRTPGPIGVRCSGGSPCVGSGLGSAVSLGRTVSYGAGLGLAGSGAGLDSPAFCARSTLRCSARPSSERTAGIFDLNSLAERLQECSMIASAAAASGVSLCSCACAGAIHADSNAKAVQQAIHRRNREPRTFERPSVRLYVRV